MNINKSTLFWGILLIGGGILALADQLGYIENLSPTLWIFVFALVSLLGFFNYATSGFKQWSWLFPAGIFGGLAVMVALLNSHFDNPAIASALFFGLLLPFAAAYLTDRTRNWWALIPGGVMLFIALTTLLVDNVGGEWIGALFLFLFGLAFLAVYFNNRTRFWALIVAYVFGVLSIAPAMASAGGSAPAYFGAVFLFAVALPFYILYFRSSENNWWAIIPAGSLTVVGIITALAIAGFINDATSGGYVNAFMMAGLAAVFAVLWLRHNKPWTKIVSILLGVIAIASVFFVSYYEIMWPVVIILGGIYLMYTAMRKPKVV